MTKKRSADNVFSPLILQELQQNFTNIEKKNKQKKMMFKQNINIRYEFLFSVAHRCMNAMGPVQS